jgi:hypothetical protein
MARARVMDRARLGLMQGLGLVLRHMLVRGFHLGFRQRLDLVLGLGLELGLGLWLELGLGLGLG